ncbi:hypothetical protein LCC91_11430 [Tepidimonas taiwanensis]|uniref:hypothetical protein n=1 Tax=Tepidimonas taiwanensis TaxID=307486 RepID=UPI001CCB0AB3|nr:hypothetical protein [Tepidimonas taiwanensis]UBQ05142.1 hypothetical protein LCC91_11430 [Tepidimonas taiwanensis]
MDGNFWKSLIPLIVSVVFLALPGSLLSSFIIEWSQKGLAGISAQIWLPVLGLGLLALLMGAALLWSLRDRVIPARVEQHDTVRPRRVLITFLSSIKEVIRATQLPDGSTAFVFTLGSGSGANSTAQAPRSPGGGADPAPPIPPIQTLAEFANHERILGSWQQLARGILPHLDKLECVVLLPSSNPSGSLPPSCEQVDLAIEIFTHLIRNQTGESRAITIETMPPANFEDFRAIMDQLEGAIRLCKHKGFALSDMVIDVTGGQKTTSIAGALTTLDKRELDLQYVPPGDKGNMRPKVKGYRVSTPTLT